MVRVHLLGPFAMESQSGDILLPTAKVRSLAAYLFWQRGRWIRRDYLRGLLWGDIAEDRAAANLRTALYLLRRSLSAADVPRDLLEIRRDGVRVAAGPECIVDSALFEEKAWAGLQEREGDVDLLMVAAGLYRGDFLEDLDSDWCLAERRRLADLYVAVLRTLVARLTSLNLPEAAVSYASRWLAADPLDEAAHRTLMRLYACLGQHNRVVGQYEQCREILERELGIPPEDATRQLLAELVGGVRKNAGARPEHNRAPSPGRPALHHPAAESATGAENLSTDPLRNARLLLLSGESLTLLGKTHEGIDSLEKALTAYERFGGLAAKARLMLGEALIWLSIPLAPQQETQARQKGVRYIEQSLEHYRSSGPPAELGKALQLAAQAYWVSGANSRASALAEEGLSLAVSTGDREAEGRMATLLGVALREQHRLKEALQAFDRAFLCVPYLSSSWEVLWVILQRGILSYIVGDLAEAERFLREALALCRVNIFPSLMIKVGECMTRSMMVVGLHYRDEVQAMDEFLKPEMGRFNPEPFVYLNQLFAAGENKRLVLPGVEGWLRARLFRLPAPMIACTIRSLVEEMLAEGLFRESARWAGLGVRLSRVREWGGFEAFFYCLRALALLKMERVRAAATCRKRAEQRANEADRWTRAWLARVDGLLAASAGDAAAARRLLVSSKRLFQQIGSRYDARFVEREIQHI